MWGCPLNQSGSSTKNSEIRHRTRTGFLPNGGQRFTITAPVSRIKNDINLWSRGRGGEKIIVANWGYTQSYKQTHHEQIVEGRLVRGHSLHDHACRGPHGQAPVLNLLKLQLGLLCRVPRELKGVDSEVSRLTVPGFLAH